MVDKAKAQDEIRQITEIIQQTVPAERIYLFGSYAYGEPNERSDYDFFVVLPDDSMRPLDAEGMIHRAVAHTSIITAMDVLTQQKARFDLKSRYNTLERKVLRDGRLLYG